MTYYLAPSLVALRDEINARYPNRDKTSDGWIGDTSHQAAVSDHNPDYGNGGVVRAIDIDIDGGTPTDPLVKTLLEAVIGDPRVWYVIFNHKIYSRTYGFAARTYTGANAHTQHVHVSIAHTDAAERGTAKWLGTKTRVKPLPLDLEILREQMRRAAGIEKGEVKATVMVRRLQKALNAKYGKHLGTDGVAGDNTLDSFGRHERAQGIVGGPRIPDMKTLPSLIRGRYFIKEEAPKGKSGKDRK